MRPHALGPTLPLLPCGKVALLLGVSFRFSCAVASIDGLRTIGLHAGGGHGATGGGGSGGGGSFGYELLVDATGARCPLFEALGFGQVTVLKSAQALGLVCHLKNTKTKEETQVHEIDRYIDRYIDRCSAAFYLSIYGTYLPTRCTRATGRSSSTRPSSRRSPTKAPRCRTLSTVRHTRCMHTHCALHAHCTRTAPSMLLEHHL